jgi:glycerol kinase
LAVGFWENIEEVKKQWHVDSRFEADPKVDMHLAKRKWSEAIYRAQSWIK